MTVSFTPQVARKSRGKKKPDGLDLRARAALADATGSLSPQSMLLAWADWLSHLAMSPGKQSELQQLAARQARELLGYGVERLLASLAPTRAAAVAEPPATDHRFDDPQWHQWPFSIWRQAFLLNQQWWDAATHDVMGVDRHHEKVAAFTARQLLDMFAPSNQLATNPVVLQRTLKERGANLQRGWQCWIDDLRRQLSGQPPEGTERFVVGKDVAVTPGKIVLRTPLMELIQYSPSTDKVHPEPVLLVAAWIMKYYILDLSPHNSLVKYLVDQGHTVFCISWKNPGAAERDIGLEDYLEMGFHAALNAIGAIVPDQRVHAAGYCLGGTLLTIAEAAMARNGDKRLASISLFAAQADFSEPGELALFIDESQVSLLEAQMDKVGYLRADQMSGAFQMLRSYDLLWSKIVNDYLLGDRRPMNDLMAWNADATRMPAKMHSQYLRRMFLNNELSTGHYPVDGRPVSLGDITLPVFCVGTETDHVAPWRSVYKLHYLAPAEITFALTSGGHNAGIVSEPGRPRRHYRLHKRSAGEGYMSPDEWLASVDPVEGSWWTSWIGWLKARSGAPGKRPPMGAPAKGYRLLGDAPGVYVLEK